MPESLIIKDGNGNLQNLAVESSSYGYAPYHYVGNTVTVAGSVSVYDVTPPPTFGIPYSILSSYFSWVGNPDDGTYVAALNDPTRKGLVIFNPGPYNVYIGIASDDAGTTNGFSISNTASAPDVYSFILYPSGTYIADSSTSSFLHGLYHITGAVNPVILITQTL